MNQSPEPWMLNAYFFNPEKLSDANKSEVAAYLHAHPLVKKGYEDMLENRQKGMERASKMLADQKKAP